MQDQLGLLTKIIAVAVKRHGADKPLTLGHLLNICKLAKRFEHSFEKREEANHRRLLNEINPFGQD